MAIKTNIEWTDHTCNIWHGCTKVHTGCDNCYAECLSLRWGHNVWGVDKPRRYIKSAFDDLAKFQTLAAKEKLIRRVFVGSMQDIFERPMPMIASQDNLMDTDTGQLRQLLFQKISDGHYPNLMFLLLTKRPSNINKYIPEEWKLNPPANVMFGTSPVNQATANNLVEHLIQVNGKRFLSIEPQLESLTLMPWLQRSLIDWVIVGGESGRGKRPFNTDWGRQLRNECYYTNTPFFFKQVDMVQPIPADLLIKQFYN